MAQSVKHRRVFYVPGYDPILPRKYREMYRTEGTAQAAISGYELSLSARSDGGGYGWLVDAKIDGQKTHSEVDFLLWSDIVQHSMQGSILWSYMLLFRTAWAYISTGALWRLMKLPAGPIIAALYPIVTLLLILVFAFGAGIFVASLLTALTGFLSFGIVMGVAVFLGTMAVSKRLDRKLYYYYLLHDYSFSARYRGANPPELEARMAEFVEIIQDALQSDTDEVLIVGHSSGAHMAIMILSDLIRKYGIDPKGPPLALLTLGHVVPMVSFLPDAWKLRGDLKYLSARRDLTWVDVTAPGDGCCFPLCDPAAVSGVAPKDQAGPLIISAQFKNSLSEEFLEAHKWRYFRMHFQYVSAFDRPLDYDYFQITAGPELLMNRYDGRKPSPSKITRAVNKFTSTTP